MTSTTERRDDALTIADFELVREMGTRWSDYDVYGHVNNAVYFELFDTAINSWVAEETGFTPASASTIAVVAESTCRFIRELARFPHQVSVAIRIDRLGSSSVTYDLGLFSLSSNVEPAPIAARGRWVHVFIDRDTRRPTPIPTSVRSALERHLLRPRPPGDPTPAASPHRRTPTVN